MAGTDGPRTIRVARHADVVAAATDPKTYSSAVSRHLNVPNGMDGEEHRRYRGLVDRYLSEEKARELVPVCREVAADLAAELPMGQPVDIVRGFGRHYAVRAQSRWLGWPADLEDRLVDWMRENRRATRSGDHAQTAAVAERFDAGIRRLVDARRAARPGATGIPVDVTDQLAHDSIDGVPLTHEEVVSILRNWTAGDLGTIARCIGSIVHGIATDRSIQTHLRAGRDDDELLDSAIDELLRIDDPFLSNRRVATRDAELGGCPVTAGDRLALDWVAANRDPEVFEDPLGFRPAENAAHNLVYGIGPHVCPGRALSTMELRVALRELLARTSDISLDPGTPPRREEHPVAGFHSLHVLLQPA